MSIKKVVTMAGLLAALALFAMMAVGCSDDGDEDPPRGDGSLTPAQIQEIDGRLGAGASRLVGSYIDRHEWDVKVHFQSFTFEPNGKVCEAESWKIGSFWFEDVWCDEEMWRVSGDTLYIRSEYDGDEDFSIFTFVGDIIMIDSYHKYTDEWYTWEMKRISDFTTFKNSLGTFVAQDPLLRSTPDIYELMWRLSTDESVKLAFDGIYLYEAGRYIDGYFDYMAWYTIGNRLFLVGVDATDDDYWEDRTHEIVETIELEYRFQTINGERRLIITHNGREDVWLPRDLAGDYYYSPPLSKRSSNIDKRANPLFGISKKGAPGR